VALHESYSLTGELLNAWCRERRLFAHQLSQWQAQFCKPLVTDRKEDVLALRNIFE
jgi:hypothetical protein